MTLLTQKFSKPVLAGAIRVVTFVLFLAALGSFAYVANAGGYTVTTPDDQVPFTVTGTAVLTGVTKLPGGLTQLDFSLTGFATHLGTSRRRGRASRIIRGTLAPPVSWS